MARAGLEVGLTAIDMRTTPAPGFQSLNSQWMLLSANAERLQDLAETMRTRTELMNLPATHATIGMPRREELERTALWTDDYSDLFSALK